MAERQRSLLAVIELGGYPDFRALYERLGFRCIQVGSVRKAIATLKRDSPDVVVAEFNYQSDFRDRTSNLESLLATLQARHPATRVVVFHERSHAPHLPRLLSRFRVFAALALPVEEREVEDVLRRALAG